FLGAATCLKHEGFSEEREWRAVHAPNVIPSPLMAPHTEIIRGVPQQVYEIPLDKTASLDLDDIDFNNVFEDLIIGPSAHPWLMYDAFVDLLKRVGITDAENRVRVSNSPIRA